MPTEPTPTRLAIRSLQAAEIAAADAEESEGARTDLLRCWEAIQMAEYQIAAALRASMAHNASALAAIGAA